MGGREGTLFSPPRSKDTFSVRVGKTTRTGEDSGAYVPGRRSGSACLVPAAAAAAHETIPHQPRLEDSPAAYNRKKHIKNKII